MAVRQAMAHYLFPPAAIFIFGGEIHLQGGLSRLLFTSREAGRKHLLQKEDLVSSASKGFRNITTRIDDPDDVYLPFLARDNNGKEFSRHRRVPRTRQHNEMKR